MPKLYQSTDDHHYYTKLHRGSNAGIVTYQIHPHLPASYPTQFK